MRKKNDATELGSDLQVAKFLINIKMIFPSQVINVKMSTQLFKAIYSGDLEKLKQLCHAGTDIHRCNEAVRWASEYGHLGMVKYLVSLGADIRSCNNEAVQLASEYGHIEVVKYLWEEACADIRSDNDYAVRRASANGHYEVVKYLCEAGADIRSDNDYAVECASENGHLEMVKYLVSLGADIQSDNDLAVRWASQNGHYEVVKYLYEAGADISEISEKHKKYILFCEKMKNKIRERAQKKIYFWWIPICYDLNHPSGCGKRMMQKNWEKAKELGMEFK